MHIITYLDGQVLQESHPVLDRDSGKPKEVPNEFLHPVGLHERESECHIRRGRSIHVKPSHCCVCYSRSSQDARAISCLRHLGMLFIKTHARDFPHSCLLMDFDSYLMTKVSDRTITVNVHAMLLR